MAEETIHTRTFQVTVGFTDVERDKFLDEFWRRGKAVGIHGEYMSRAIRSEIVSNLESVGLDATVTIVERMAVG